MNTCIACKKKVKKPFLYCYPCRPLSQFQKDVQEGNILCGNIECFASNPDFGSTLDYGENHAALCMHCGHIEYEPGYNMCDKCRKPVKAPFKICYACKYKKPN